MRRSLVPMEDKINHFCNNRAARLATLIHAITRIPLGKGLKAEVKQRMFDSAILAENDDDITARVNAAQDDFMKDISFRTPTMWKFCRSASIQLAMRLSGGKSVAWRMRTTKTLCRRLFRHASRSVDDEDVDNRIDEVFDAVLIEYGLA